MTTATKPRKQVKVERTLKVLRPIAAGRMALQISMTRGNKTEMDVYQVEELSNDFGTAAYRLTKEDGEHYDTLLDLTEGKHSCECKGFLRWGHCKHTDGLAKLHQFGKLANRQPVAKPSPKRDPHGWEDTHGQLPAQVA